MLQDPDCAICGGHTWDEVATKRYSSSEIPGGSYNEVRYKVLFELWFSGADHVELKSILCRQCGFLCYSPRPESSDIEQKYTYIAEHEHASREFSSSKRSDTPRAQELFATLRKYLKKEQSTILDYGGGNGRLLRPLVDAGHNCFTLEIVDETLPGVKYAGSKPADLAQFDPFDALICSHVLEHLANPLETLQELVPYVQTDGFIYLEVPSEIWRRAPPAIDPVTHINFFTTDSLRVLLEAAGLEVISCRYQSFIRPNSMVGIAVKAIARKTRSNSMVTKALPGPGMVYAQLNPNLVQRIARTLRHPRILLNLLHKND